MKIKRKTAPCASRRNLATNLQLARTVLKLSQDDLASKCMLKRTYIGAIERCDMNPGIDNLDKIARGLGIESHLLLMNPEAAYPKLSRALSADSKVAPGKQPLEP